MGDQGPKTFREYIQGVEMIFDNPDTGKPYDEINRVFQGGDFAMDETAYRSLIMLGQSVLDMAKEEGVDLTQFPEMKAVMGFDNRPENLSPEEVGAMVAGLALEGTLHVSPSNGKVVANLGVMPSATIGATGNDKSAVEIGQQLVGDNHPEISSEDTSGPVNLQPNPRPFLVR